jgi:PKD repeat protein
VIDSIIALTILFVKIILQDESMKKTSPCLLLFFLLFLVAATAALSLPVKAADMELYSYKLSQSTGSYQFWTVPPSHRVFKDDPIPADEASGGLIYAARNEFEPFQLVVQPAASGSTTVSISSFGSGIITELYQVKYVPVSQATDSLGRTGPYPDPLWPLTNGANVALTANENTAFWFNIFVPSTTASGDYPATITIGGVSIPVTLHVFNFALPEDIHIKSQMNFSHATILDMYGVSGTGSEYWQYVDAIKQFFIDHRLTMKSVLWSGGLTSSGGAPYIDYDCAATLSDPHGIWGFEDPAARYLAGSGLLDGHFTALFNNGSGFPSFMAMTFQNNDSSADQRPANFCGLSRGTADWYTADNPVSAYNQKWFQYMTVVQNYLLNHGYLDKAYYYFANEPQDQADYDAVAWYSRYLKQAAPNLRLLVSENPKPEIYNQANYVSDGQIDIWMPVLNEYDPVISQAREKDHGEESWTYFLHGTRPPYFNPITLDHPGIESKFTGWFLWKYRIRGIAYYSLNNWSKNPWTDPLNDNHNGDLFMWYPPSENNTAIAYGSNSHRFVPSIRFELMRDSLEDYEYLYILNNNSRPEVDQLNSADPQVDKIISGLTSYTRDDEFIYNLRRLIGLKNGNEITSIPDIQPPPVHPRAEGDPGDYYINFQDIAGSPAADPLLVNGHTYMKIGWNTYDANLGYGWYGDMAHVMYQYRAAANELQASILYDNWGRQKTFEFDLPNGTYSVTVSVGWEGVTYYHNFISIEGVSFINDEASTPYLVRTREVTITDNKLTMAMGIFDEYTMLNYLDIEAVSPPLQPPVAGFTADITQGTAPLTVTFTDSSSNSPTSWQWDFDNNGSTDATTQNPVHVFTAADTYSVRLTAVNAAGSDDELQKNYIQVTVADKNRTMPWLYLLLGN